MAREFYLKNPTPPPCECMGCLSHRCSVSLLNKWGLFFLPYRAQLGRVGGSRWGWVLQIKFPCQECRPPLPCCSFSVGVSFSLVAISYSAQTPWEDLGGCLLISDFRKH